MLKFAIGEKVYINKTFKRGEVKAYQRIFKVTPTVRKTEKVYLIDVEGSMYPLWIDEKNLTRVINDDWLQDGIDLFCDNLTRERNINIFLDLKDFDGLKQYLEER